MSAPTQRNGYQTVLYCLLPNNFGAEDAGRWVVYLSGATFRGWTIDRIGPSFATFDDASRYVEEYFPEDSFPHLDRNPQNRAMHSADRECMKAANYTNILCGH